MSRAVITLHGAQTKTCACCGEPFSRDKRNTWAYWERAKYCSTRCFATDRSRKAAELRPALADEFSKWFDKSDGCWEWRGALDRNGYGAFSYARRTYRAPKIALELDGRPVPKGMYACHACDNPRCVRPDHLYPGTPKQNSADAIARGRIRYGKKAKITTEQVKEIRSSEQTDQEIADRFGISRSNVSMIRSRRTWRRVP